MLFTAVSQGHSGAIAARISVSSSSCIAGPTRTGPVTIPAAGYRLTSIVRWDLEADALGDAPDRRE